MKTGGGLPLVHPPALAVHTDAGSAGLDRLDPILAGELASLARRPRSVFMMSGARPATLMASRYASMQKPASIVVDTRHERTARVCQSMIATR